MKNSIYILIITLFFLGCEKTFFEEAPQNNPIAMFEELWGTFNTDYANFDERHVDWNEIYSTYRPLVTDQTSDAELQQIFREMLIGLDDGHVELIFPNQKVFKSNRIYNEKINDQLFDLDLIKSNYLKGRQKINGYGGNTYGLLNENIGYVHFKWSSDNFNFMEDILNEFVDARALIIDLRHNSGGQLTDVVNNMGRLTSEKRLTSKSRTKNGPNANDFDEWFEWYIEPEGKYFDKQLILLTDRYTISAGERATLALKTLPNLTHLGEITNGGLSTKIYHELPNGWLYSVCPQEVVSADGQFLEGIGISPDVPVQNTYEDLQNGVDSVLEKAISIIE